MLGLVMKHYNTLRQHREARGITQFDVAKRVDIHIDRYGRMENGKTPPSYLEGIRLAQFFDVPADELFPQPEASVA